MHTEHGGPQPGHPTCCPRGDCSGYCGLRMVDRDENKEGNGWRSNEVGGRGGPLTAGSSESLVDLSFQREFSLSLNASHVSEQTGRCL